MSQDPYRRQGEESQELARLAQQGQARLQAAHSGEDRRARAAAERNLRTALGPVRGAPLKRAILVLLVLCVIAQIAGLVLGELVALDDLLGFSLRPFRFAGLFASAWLFAGYLFVPPMASRASVEAERAWVASLPFPLDWYFELLASEPDASVRVRVELWWSTSGVDARTLAGILALFDTDSTVLEVHGAHASFTTGRISGMTGIRINRSNVYRNHRLGKAVHRLVEVVLLPIHRNAPLARVKLSRSF